MKYLIVLVVVLGVLGFFYGFVHMLNEDERQSERRNAEWLTYSEQHHCNIIREESFANPTTLWKCDGNFEVRR